MNYFIVGATGFIGKNFIKTVSMDDNVIVNVLVRNNANSKYLSDISRDNVVIHYGDLLDPKSLQNCIEPNSTFINFAYMQNQPERENVICVKNMISACIVSGISRFLHISTTSVYGRSSELMVDESSICLPKTAYARTKFELEKIILSEGLGYFDVGIIRPTVVFGKDGLNLHKFILDLMGDGFFQDFFRASFHKGRPLNLVHVSKVVAAIKFLCNYDNSLNGDIFIVGDSENPLNNFDNVEKILRNVLCLPSRTLEPPCTPIFLRSIILYALGRDHIKTNQIFSSKKIIDIGFNYRDSFEDDLKFFARSYIQNDANLAII